MAQNGWEAIRDAFNEIYADSLENTQQFGTLIGWQLGGPDPLDSFRVYDGGDFWHIVGFGLSELFEKQSENQEVSGYGLEFTMKLRKAGMGDESSELKCAAGIFNALARLTFEKGEQFFPDEYIYTGQEQGVDFNQRSRLTGFVTALDQAGTIDTPNGKVDFVQLIGATDAELRAVMDKKLTVRELVEKIGELTDYTRDSVVLGG